MQMLPNITKKNNKPNYCEKKKLTTQNYIYFFILILKLTTFFPLMKLH